MFEQASRLKLRFETPKGNLTVEDLWDLPLTSERSASLDGVAKKLNKQLKDTAEESFVVKATAKDTELQLAFDIVKHIISVRLAENEAAATARKRSEEKGKILEIISRKKDQALESASVEEPEARLAAL